jgi:hypothetical protein
MSPPVARCFEKPRQPTHWLASQHGQGQNAFLRRYGAAAASQEISACLWPINFPQLVRQAHSALIDRLCVGHELAILTRREKTPVRKPQFNY